MTAPLSKTGLRSLERKLASINRGSELDKFRSCLPNFIELRTMPLMPDKLHGTGIVSGAPLMRTYSALGILKNATEPPNPKIAFVSPEKYQEINSYPWNQQYRTRSGFYTLLRNDENPDDNVDFKDDPALKKIEQEVESWLWLPRRDPVFVYEPKFADTLGDDYIKGNRRLGLFRRYILIIEDDQPPINPAYVVHAEHGKWYYIDGHDEISRNNFTLISLFLTMMAVPSTTPPISPTISVGGG